MGQRVSILLGDLSPLTISEIIKKDRTRELIGKTLRKKALRRRSWAGYFEFLGICSLWRLKNSAHL